MELVRASIVSLPVYEGDGAEDTTDERFAKLCLSWDRGLGARADLKKEAEAVKA